ncbi:hypothetical protein FOMPIDRAFT_127976 [Fomitopsis schrenkii]|uniref:Methyltransferase domain-containing protein n=1 Tax=Fomitopsis schrenkii TaxID=2126942 RepID=S8FWD6_FOMSC|nr:hypothetical protein FOMPIDRAFT_127976 [Fomitopsis schrenkii]
MTEDFDKQVFKHPLNPESYRLAEDEIAFHKAQTGIQDDEELKSHIIAVQRDAYEVFPYPCIRWFTFARLQISRVPAYTQLLELGRARPDAIFLEVGCCFGSDMRKAVADGFPVQNCIASDLRPEYWQLGHRLFNSTPATFPVPFLPGDLFDPAFLAPSSLAHTTPTSPPPALASLTSLTPLTGHVSAIYAAELFHLFSADKQLALAQQLAALLSPAPGSFIFGWQVGSATGGLFELDRSASGVDPLRLWYHSPESWRAMWTDVFGGSGGAVEVYAELQPLPSAPDVNLNETGKLVWTVTRMS